MNFSPDAPLAIVSPMHEELRALLPLVDDVQRVLLAGRTFHLGCIGRQPVVLVLSGIGKVAAGATTALLLSHFKAAAVVFTGVAGGLGAGVRVGDIVVASSQLQHDMDCSPLFPRFEVPLTGTARFATDVSLSTELHAAAARVIGQAETLIGRSHLADFGITQPQLHTGMIVSGDRFVSTSPESHALVAALPDALAVEMEGGAAAQVCADFKRPFASLRTISDRADDDAHADFSRFIVEVASVYTRALVHDWLVAR